MKKEINFMTFKWFVYTALLLILYYVSKEIMYLIASILCAIVYGVTFSVGFIDFIKSKGWEENGE